MWSKLGILRFAEMPIFMVFSRDFWDFTDFSASSKKAFLITSSLLFLGRGFGLGFGRFRLKWGGAKGHLTSPNPSFFLGVLFFVYLGGFASGLGFERFRVRWGPPHWTLPYFGFLLFVIYFLGSVYWETKRPFPAILQGVWSYFSKNPFLQMLFWFCFLLLPSSNSSCYYFLFFFLFLFFLFFFFLLFICFLPFQYSTFFLPLFLVLLSFFSFSIVLNSFDFCFLHFLSNTSLDLGVLPVATIWMSICIIGVSLSLPISVYCLLPNCFLCLFCGLEEPVRSCSKKPLPNCGLDRDNKQAS